MWHCDAHFLGWFCFKLEISFRSHGIKLWALDCGFQTKAHRFWANWDLWMWQLNTMHRSRGKASFILYLEASIQSTNSHDIWVNHRWTLTTYPSLFGNDGGLAVLGEISRAVMHDWTVIVVSPQGVHSGSGVFFEVVFVCCLKRDVTVYL